MTENRIVSANGSSIVLYTADDGNTQLEVKLEKDTVWLTQNQMAELFGRDRTVVGRHMCIFCTGHSSWCNTGKDAYPASTLLQP